MKQNIKAIKAQSPGISQSQAMQVLSEMWKQSKGTSVEQAGGVEDLVAGLGKLAV